MALRPPGYAHELKAKTTVPTDILKIFVENFAFPSLKRLLAGLQQKPKYNPINIIKKDMSELVQREHADCSIAYHNGDV